MRSSFPSFVALTTSVVWSAVANICSTPRREGEEDMTKYSSGVVVDTHRLYTRARFFRRWSHPRNTARRLRVCRRFGGQTRGGWPVARWPVFSGGELKELARAGRMVSPSKHRPDTSILPSLAGLNDERGVYPLRPKSVLLRAAKAPRGRIFGT